MDAKKRKSKNTKLLSENRTESVTLENQNKNMISYVSFHCVLEVVRLDKAFSSFINILCP